METEISKENKHSKLDKALKISTITGILIVAAFIMNYFFIVLPEKKERELELRKSETDLLKQQLLEISNRSELLQQDVAPIQESSKQITGNALQNTGGVKTVTCVTFFNTKVQVSKEECDYIERLNSQSQSSKEEFDRCMERLEDKKDDCYKTAIDNLSESGIEDCAEEAKNKAEECVDKHENTIKKLWKN